MYNTQVKPADQPIEEKVVFFKTSNSGYGVNWLSSDNDATNPTKKEGVPLYQEIGERDLALNHVKKLYKHKLLAEMRERGELDTEIYRQIEEEKKLIKKLDVQPKPFPSNPEEMRYP